MGIVVLFALVLTQALSLSAQQASGPTPTFKPGQEETNKPPAVELPEQPKPSTIPLWKASAFGKDCVEVPDGRGGKKKECPPPVSSPSPKPPRLSPCSEVGSCAPGVGSKGGVFDLRKGESPKLLIPEIDGKKLVGDQLTTTGAGSKASGDGSGTSK